MSYCVHAVQHSLIFEPCLSPARGLISWAVQADFTFCPFLLLRKWSEVDKLSYRHVDADLLKHSHFVCCHRPLVVVDKRPRSVHH